MNIKPIKDYILIQPDKDDVKTESGLYIKTDKKPEYGIVQAVGDEVKTIMVDDKVFYKPYALTNIEELALLKEEEVLAIIK